MATDILLVWVDGCWNPRLLLPSQLNSTGRVFSWSPLPLPLILRGNAEVSSSALNIWLESRKHLIKPWQFPCMNDAYTEPETVTFHRKRTTHKGMLDRRSLLALIKMGGGTKKPKYNQVQIDLNGLSVISNVSLLTPHFMILWQFTIQQLHGNKENKLNTGLVPSKRLAFWVANKMHIRS